MLITLAFFSVAMILPRLRKRRAPPDITYPVSMTFDDICRSVLIFGQTGSGKSWMMIRLLAGLIRKRCCVIGACAKLEAWEELRQACRMADAEDRFVLFGPKYGHRLNVLRFILNIEGGSPELAAQFFDKLNQIVLRATGSQEEAFWANLFNNLSVAAIRLVMLTCGNPSLEEVYKVIISTPSSLSMSQNKDWRAASECYRLLMALHEKAKADPSLKNEFDRCWRVLMEEQPMVGDKAHGACLSMCGGLFGKFLIPPFDRIFASPEPDSCSIAEWERTGAVVAIDAPTLVYDMPGRLMNACIVMLAQMHALRRPSKSVDRPLIIARDEASEHISADHDMRVQVVGRSAKLAHIDAVQDMDVLITALGGQTKAQHEAKAFASNHAHAFAFKNADMETNNLMSQLIGTHRELYLSSGQDCHGQPTGDPVKDLLGVGNRPGWSEHREDIVHPFEFFRLDTGTCFYVAHGTHQFLDLRERKR